MLQLNLLALDRGEVRVRESIPADAPLWDDVGFGLAGPVEIELAAQSVGEGVLVRGPLRTRVELECRRCLTAVEIPVEKELGLWFVAFGPEDEADADGESYPLPARGDTLDLREAVREQLVLAVPGFALCRETCEGICAVCGSDRNLASCGCAQPPSPSPWDALKDVKWD